MSQHQIDIIKAMKKDFMVIEVINPKAANIIKLKTEFNDLESIKRNISFVEEVREKQVEDFKHHAIKQDDRDMR